VKYILRRRPSPALVISCIALFVSMGGVSYGVATGFIDSREIRNNTITSGDVRNNTLRTFDIRNNEVRGFDVRNSSLQGRDIAFNTLTGADINESSLGKVPSAALADNASAVTVLKTFPQTTVGLGAAPVALLTHGPLTLSAACVDVAGDTVARLLIQTTQTAAAGGTVDVPSIAPSDGAVPIAALTAAGPGPQAVGDSTIFASAGSQAFTGQFAMRATAVMPSVDSCTFHGHVILNG
jgi:hypothetical protein